MSILEDLWYGNICPIEQENPMAGECKELEDLLKRNCDKLESTLNEYERETLQKAKDCWDELFQYTECGAFMTGFRLAVQLMVASVQSEAPIAPV